MDFTRVAAVADIPAGQCKVVELSGREIALFNLDGKFYAIDNVCPHRGGPLSEGTLEGAEVICPWHGWRFDVTNGACMIVPTKNVDAFEVKVEGEDIFVKVERSDTA